MAKTNVSCDYAGYDYKTEFWVKANRKYEDSLEKKTIQRLLGPALKEKGCF